jgi:hypothetical protein
MRTRLIEVEKGKWRLRWHDAPVARSALPLPYVISDEMPPTEQVDGNYYTSKTAFRRIGRALGLTEVGTEKFKPKRRSTDAREVKDARRQSLRTAMEKYRAGHRPRR